MKKNKRIIKPDVMNTSTKTVYGTTDLDKFNLITGQRPISQGAVEKITVSLLIKNLMKDYPAYVNPSYGIIDGQNRWQSCKDWNKKCIETGVGEMLVFYYCIVEGFQIEDIIRLNESNPWSLEDYLVSFVDRKFLNYIKLKKFANEYGFNKVAPLLSAFGIRGSAGEHTLKITKGVKERKMSTEDYKNGDFLYPAEDKYFRDLVKHILKLGSIAPGIDCRHSTFVGAVARIFQEKVYKTTRMMEKMRQCREIEIASSIPHNIKALLKIYNKGESSENRIFIDTERKVKTKIVKVSG